MGAAQEKKQCLLGRGDRFGTRRNAAARSCERWTMMISIMMMMISKFTVLLHLI